MSEKNQPQALDRRRFLMGASVGAAAAAASQIVAAPAAQAMDPGPDETKARYRETDHVKKFYQSNRY
ncbi:MAG: twin-arginine translocation signal domain-containing protein [Hyphomicrobiales bacterium]|nr:twin-arginine translocation signal domain-containing protein [Hyphomicrobiales bacterium]